MSEYKPWGGALSSADKPDTVILGVPYDATSTNRKGAAKGPQAIREASSSCSINPCTEEGKNLCNITRLADHGDVTLPEDPAAIAQEIRKATAGIIASGAVPLLLGGDHAITPPAVQAVAEAHGTIDILYMDAHPDLYETYNGSAYTHASSGYRIAREVKFGRFVQVGIRMPYEGQLEQARQMGIQVITAYHLVAPDDLRFENPTGESF